MIVVSSRFVTSLLAFAFLSAAAQAGTLSGTVINRTTGKPAPDVTLDLLSPTQGMAELATTKSDAQGRFSVTKDSIGMAPVLIRATFHDVSFNTFSPPGRPDVEVEIYDLSKDLKTITVDSRIIIFQPRGDKLLGAEEYTIQNSANPPVAFFRADGNFDFSIPSNSTLGQVSTITSMGMPINQATIDKGKGHYSISYPFRPGETKVRLSYDIAYPNNSASLNLPSTYAGSKILVVVPPGVTVTGDGLAAAGEEQGMMVYTHDPLPAKGILSVSLSGVGSAPAEGAKDQSETQEGNSRQDQGPEVIAAPSRLDDFKWYLFAGLAAIFAMGAILLSRKQVVVTPDGDDEVAPPVSNPSRSGQPSKSKKVAPPSSAAAAASSAEQHVASSMEALKDQLFRLELRRQAGTISESDYAREKAHIDKLLRDLVQS